MILLILIVFNPQAFGDLQNHLMAPLKTLAWTSPSLTAWKVKRRVDSDLY